MLHETQVRKRRWQYAVGSLGCASPPSGALRRALRRPLTVCFCQPILSMISAKVTPFFRWSMATTWAVLLPSRGALASCVLGARLPGSAFLAGVAFLGRLDGCERAPLAPCAPPLATLNAYDGEVTSNMAVVPTSSAGISAFAINSTYLVLDLFGYFAP
jgi:hypothetical protein